eukprot:tig00001343_g8336.t1
MRSCVAQPAYVDGPGGAHAQEKSANVSLRVPIIDDAFDMLEGLFKTRRQEAVSPAPVEEFGLATHVANLDGGEATGNQMQKLKQKAHGSLRVPVVDDVFDVLEGLFYKSKHD